jgi:double-stranded uracil-DNA glycosylase
MKNSAADKLPDLLRDGLDVVFVGTAAGKRSAELGQYYAHPGNKFWRTLHETGLTPRRLAPSAYSALLDFGIGATDLCKTQAGGDHEIDDYDVEGFARKMRRFAPRAIAFTSKKGGSLFLRCSTGDIDFAKHPILRDGEPAVFVLPSPSGRAGGYWDIAPWRALARWLKAAQL